MSRQRSFPPERAAILAWSGAAAALAVAGAALAHGWSEEGVRTVVRASARLSVTCFCLAFGASALRALWPSPAADWMLRNRRQLGLSFAGFHFLHLGALVALALSFPSPFLENLQPATLAGGGLAYLFIAVQAATSNDASVRWLGRRRWTLLHTVGSYIIWLIFAQSYVPRAIASPAYLPFGVLVLGVVALRAARAVKLRAAAGSRATRDAGAA
jgi:sulfoxide reductase heme-binding subunit YedZ